MQGTTTISISLPDDLAQQMPAEPVERQRVFELGLKQWRVRQALEAFKRGEGTLAYAAKQAGVSLREMIPLAYAYGLAPKVDAARLSGGPLSLDQAATL